MLNLSAAVSVELATGQALACALSLYTSVEPRDR